MKGFVGLSLVPASQFCCAGVSAFRIPIVGILSLVLAITTTHCTVHMSVAWQRGSVGTCNLSVSRERDGHGRLVGRSVGRRVGWSVHARGPIDHPSVGPAPIKACSLATAKVFVAHTGT